MGRLFTTAFPGFLLVFVCTTTSVYATLTLEEQFQKFSENFIQLEENVRDWKLQVELKNQQLEILTAKVVRLERLVEQSEKTSSSKEFDEMNTQLQQSGRSAMPRTCREAHLADPSLPSAMYWIDPDGQAVGDAPIYVYCDMDSGTTSIPHNSESPTNVGHCADPGCYSRAVNYNATNRQMKALADLSSECHQSIRYDCYYAPFEFDSVAYAWWNDKNGNAQYFWSGSDVSVHTCQCGIDRNCVDASLKCNCDSTAPVSLTDSGVISNKSVLPITRLNFGRTQLESSSGVHTLGPFECSGQIAVTGIPNSCEDLWRGGHTLSGLYSIAGATMVETVFCDFAKLPDDAGFQKWIGFADVKSSPTYFYVQKNSDFKQENTPVPFEIERLNVGQAMNLQSGKFVAPRTGKYYFSTSGRAYFAASSGRYFVIGLFKNGAGIGSAHGDEISDRDYQFENFSIQSTLDLKAGDQIWLQITRMPSGGYLTDDGNHFTHFTGWLLEEDISQSLLVI